VSGTPFSILTKGTLITRDLDLLAAAEREVEVGAAFTVGMLDEELWRSAEPGTPSPKARLDAVRALNDAGDPDRGDARADHAGPERRSRAARRTRRRGRGGRATHISPIVLHLRPGVKEVFIDWLGRAHPELVRRYRGMYRGSTAPQAYRDEIGALVADARKAAWRRHGRPAPRPPRTHYREARAGAGTSEKPAAGEQLSLF
jgi:DNA repair photolyase